MKLVPLVVDVEGWIVGAGPCEEANGPCDGGVFAVFAGCCWKLVIGSGFWVIVTAALVTGAASGQETGEAPLVSELTVRLIEPCPSYGNVTVPGLTTTENVEALKVPE